MFCQTCRRHATEQFYSGTVWCSGCDRSAHTCECQPLQSQQAMVRDFNVKFGCERHESPRMIYGDLRKLRLKLIREELTELETAMDDCDVTAATDALCDLLYVVHGMGDAMGINLEPCFEEVHRSNMTKLWPDGTVHRREDGKVIKPDTYSPANLAPIIKAQCK